MDSPFKICILPFTISCTEYSLVSKNSRMFKWPLSAANMKPVSPEYFKFKCNIIIFVFTFYFNQRER